MFVIIKRFNSVRYTVIFIFIVQHIPPADFVSLTTPLVLMLATQVCVLMRGRGGRLLAVCPSLDHMTTVFLMYLAN